MRGAGLAIAGRALPVAVLLAEAGGVSCARINQPVAVPERVKRVMAMIGTACENNLCCPTNGQIADAIGAGSVSAGANIIALLETMGLIAVERFGTGRVVTDCSTGKSTLHFGSRKPHWRARGEKPRRESKAKTYEPMPVRVLVAQTIHDREPCGWCGVRADIGCHHRPPSVPELVAA